MKDNVMAYSWTKKLSRPSKSLDRPLSGKLGEGKHAVQIEEVDLTALPTTGNVVLSVRNNKHETLQIREFVRKFGSDNELSFPVRSLLAAVADDPIDVVLALQADPRIMAILHKTRFGIVVGYSKGGRIETTSDSKFVISIDGDRMDKQFSTQRGCYYYMKDNKIKIAHKKVMTFHRIEKHEEYNKELIEEKLKQLVRKR